MSDEMQNEFVEKLKKIVEDYWERNSAPLYLADVPKEFEQAGYDYRSIVPPDLNLKKAVRYFASSDVRLIKSEREDPDDAVVPASVEESDSDLYQILWDRKISFDNKIDGKIKPPIFAAFGKPLSKDKRFIVSLDPPRFKDFLEDELSPDGSYPVPVEMIRGSDETLSNDDIAKRVAEWASSVGLELSEVSIKHSTPDPSDFWSKLQHLPDNDMQRVKIPLDIVRKLLKP